jgi:hypothetical protein
MSCVSAVSKVMTRVHAEIVKSWRKRATGPKGQGWVISVMGKKKDEDGKAVRDKVSEKGRFKLEYLQKKVRGLPVWCAPFVPK